MDSTAVVRTVGSALDIRRLALFYLAFMAAIAAGLWIGRIPDISVILWPPNGVYIGMLLLTGRQAWPRVAAVAAMAELTGNLLWFHNPLWIALTYVAINAFEAVLCAVILQRVNPEQDQLRTVEQVLAMCFIVLLAVACGATAAATFDWAVRSRAFAVSWEHWWVGDSAGILLALPLSLVAAQLWNAPFRWPRLEAVAEIVLIALVLSTLCYVAISSQTPVLFMLLLPVLWAAARFEFPGAVLSMLLLTALIGGLTSLQVGSFGLTGLGARRSHLVVQLFLAATAMTGLIVAAVARQRREAMEELRVANEQLEVRVAERTSQVQLLMREVNHRSKKLLMLVQALARRTAASGAEDFQKRFERRLHSLAASQDLLVKSEWTAVPLRDLVMGQLAHLGRDVESRFMINGPPLNITASSAQTISMALHELSTNAIKYGALSNDTGVVEVSWGTAVNADGDTMFRMDWIERGGPAVVEPERRGFGTVVIGDMVRLGLGGTVVKDFRPEGLHWSVEAPHQNVLELSSA